METPENARSKAVVVDVDPEADWQEAFRQVVSLSNQFQGPDTLSLNLVGENLGMDFSVGFTLYCPELESALRQLPGILRVSCR